MADSHSSDAEDTTSELESLIAELRAKLTAAKRDKDADAQTALRLRLRQAQRDYAAALDAELERESGRASDVPAPADHGRRPADRTDDTPPDASDSGARPAPGGGGRNQGPATLPVREQVYQALMVLGAPAAPKLISAVHEAFFAEEIVTTRLASLRRDEQRSFETQPFARPYYICTALTHDRLIAARGVLAVSLWPLERRIIGPLSPRVDFLTHAIAITEQVSRMSQAGQTPSVAATRLMRLFAANVPGAGDAFSGPVPERIRRAAESELAVHASADTAQRAKSAARARARLSDTQVLFGGPGLGIVPLAADG